METDQDRLVERRQRLAAVAEEFRAHDRVALARLPAAQLGVQTIARQLVYEHIRTVLEQAKALWEQAAIQPEWTSVAMLCDLPGDLWSTELSNGHTRVGDTAARCTAGSSDDRSRTISSGCGRVAVCQAACRSRCSAARVQKITSLTAASRVASSAVGLHPHWRTPAQA
jgi:hypothetical protein